jgi:hypothetical protein
VLDLITGNQLEFLQTCVQNYMRELSIDCG